MSLDLWIGRAFAGNKIIEILIIETSIVFCLHVLASPAAFLILSLSRPMIFSTPVLDMLMPLQEAI
jgi:hypothetical protein